MINKALLDKNVQEYSNNNLKSDISTLRMKKSPFTDVSSLELVQQIQGKKIAQSKLSFLFNNDQIIYPPHINLEQASSQSTAQFKQTLISGKKGIDLTGGTGIDSFFLSEKSEEFYYVEPNTSLLETVRHNFLALGRKNATFLNKTAEDFLAENKEKFDFIYIDPSRRDENKNKKFLLEDLAPNVIQMEEQLRHISSSIFIKLSPLLDLHQLIQQLSISNIYIICVKNEVKELLIKLETDKNGLANNPSIHCVNLESTQPDFSFRWLDEKLAINPLFSQPDKYLFIPNSSILKSGAFKLIAHIYTLKKLHPNTHIYTSDQIIPQFPGRTFAVLDNNFNPQHSKQKKFNIICRNYPLKIEKVKNKYKLIEGGDEFLFFTQDKTQIVCILAEIIK